MIALLALNSKTHAVSGAKGKDRMRTQRAASILVAGFTVIESYPKFVFGV